MTLDLSTNNEAIQRLVAFIPGRPVALQRPRINIGAAKRWKPGGHFGPLVYTPSKCKTYQRLIRQHIKAECGWSGRYMMKYPISVFATFYIKKPGTASKFAHRPDVDNYAKNLLDALDNFVIEDDAFVTRLVAVKAYVDEARHEGVELIVEGA